MSINTLTTYQILSESTVSNNLTHNLLSINAVPYDENCTQVGKHKIVENILECNVYINQLIRAFGGPPAGADFFILENTNNNEGLYYDIAIRYTDDETATGYALEIQKGCSNWDNIAKQQLTEADYSLFKSTTPVIELRRA